MKNHIDDDQTANIAAALLEAGIDYTTNSGWVYIHRENNSSIKIHGRSCRIYRRESNTKDWVEIYNLIENFLDLGEFVVASLRLGTFDPDDDL